MTRGLVEKRTRSRDGTSIAYYVLEPASGTDGPVVTWVSAPAMGAPLIAMRGVYDRLPPHVRVITWDMRGFHGSGPPPERDAYAVERHVEDLEAVVAAEGLNRFVLGGWSMGVPISLEYAAHNPSRIEGMLLIAGPFEPDLGLPIPIPGLPGLVKRLIDRIGDPVGRAVNPFSKRLLGMRGAGHALGVLGLLANEHDSFEAVLDEFRHIDWARYFKVIRWLHEHDARPYLTRVSAPSLVVVGDHDRMTPLAVARRLAGGIADSELTVVPGGTHYMPAEFPDILANRIARFLDERVARSRSPQAAHAEEGSR
ncbi:MAG: alpha/beta hydrolase [Polyangiaceae bacterium]